MVVQVILPGGAGTGLCLMTTGSRALMPELKERSALRAVALAAEPALHHAHLLARTLKQARCEAR